MHQKIREITHIPRRRVIFGVVTAVLTMACGNEPLPKAAGPQPADVMLSDVLANPKAYDLALLRVSGWCSIAFEATALWLDDETSERSGDRAVWLNLGWPVSDEIRALNGTHVVVEGRFDSQQKGHESLYSGMFVEISRIEQTPEAKEDADQRP